MVVCLDWSIMYDVFRIPAISRRMLKLFGAGKHRN